MVMGDDDKLLSNGDDHKVLCDGDNVLSDGDDGKVRVMVMMKR